jgi:hypothetical protein
LDLEILDMILIETHAPPLYVLLPLKAGVPVSVVDGNRKGNVSTVYLTPRYEVFIANCICLHVFAA